MKNNKAVKTPRKGQFQKGEDPRRNKAGVHNAERQSYTILFENAMAKGLSPEEFAELCIYDVRRHRPGAKEFFADRVMGKVTQPLSGDFDIGLKAKDIFAVMRKADEELTFKDSKE